MKSRAKDQFLRWMRSRNYRLNDDDFDLAFESFVAGQTLAVSIMQIACSRELTKSAAFVEFTCSACNRKVVVTSLQLATFGHPPACGDCDCYMEQTSPEPRFQARLEKNTMNVKLKGQKCKCRKNHGLACQYYVERS